MRIFFGVGLRPLKPDEADARLRQRLRRVKAEGTGFEPVRGFLPNRIFPDLSPATCRSYKSQSRIKRRR